MEQLNHLILPKEVEAIREELRVAVADLDVDCGKGLIDGVMRVRTVFAIGNLLRKALIYFERNLIEVVDKWK